MEIRPAKESDAAALKVLQAKCPQGTTLVVSAVNTPDFFARVKAYKDYEVYVACENDRIVGSAACGIREAVVNGQVVKVGHQFQAFIHPEYRGRRIAGQLMQTREQYLKQRGAVLAYSLIIEGNIPSMRHVERQKYRCHRTLVMPGLSVFREMDVKSFGRIRTLTVSDLDAVANLLNKTWRDYELCEPMTGNELAQFISRTPAYDFPNVFVLEEDGEIVACLGFWDWSQVTRLVVEKLNVKMQMAGYVAGIARYLAPMPRVPKVGEVLRQMMLTPIAFQNPRHLAVLLKHVNNLAFQRGIGYIYCICEPTQPLLKSMTGFARIDTAIYLYIKPLREDVSILNKPVFINGIDL
jgi:predicted N-acetyltransferase YhbS